MEPRPGTVEHYQFHARCHQHIAKLTTLIEEIATVCSERADADCVGDPPRFVPNIWMQLHTRIREDLPR